MRAPFVLLALAMVGLVAGCGGDDAEGGDGRATRDETAHAALCDAADAAAAGGAAEAHDIFFDRAHDQLHDLAARVEELDRERAARLLEAKNAVEAVLRNQTDDGLPARLSELAAATAAGIATTGGDPPEACG